MAQLKLIFSQNHLIKLKVNHVSFTLVMLYVPIWKQYSNSDPILACANFLNRKIGLAWCSQPFELLPMCRDSDVALGEILLQSAIYIFTLAEWVSSDRAGGVVCVSGVKSEIGNTDYLL